MRETGPGKKGKRTLSRSERVAKPDFTPEPLPPVFEPPPTEVESSLFEGLDETVPETALVPVKVELPALDADLTPDQREQFIKLIEAEMTVAERVTQLCKLARLSSQKTAAVGLRAIQEINEITGVKKEKTTDTPPMFVIGSDVKIQVNAVKVEK